MLRRASVSQIWIEGMIDDEYERLVLFQKNKSDDTDDDNTDPKDTEVRFIELPSAKRLLEAP